MNMKTLRTLGMAFTAILMTMGFAACSDDDNEGGQPGTPGTSGKQLVWFREGGAGENEDRVDMYYGADGWLTASYSSFGSDNDIMYRYESDGGKYTIATSYWNDGDIGHVYIFDDLLRQIDDEVCEYDAEGHLTRCGEYTFVWENGNIIRKEGGDSGIVEYTYYTDLKNTYPIDTDPLIYVLGGTDFFLSVYPQLLGTWCKNLVKTEDRYGYVTTWEYTLDADGYVTAVKEPDSDTYELEYKWE